MSTRNYYQPFHGYSRETLDDLIDDQSASFALGAVTYLVIRLEDEYDRAVEHGPDYRRHDEFASYRELPFVQEWYSFAPGNFPQTEIKDDDNKPLEGRRFDKSRRSDFEAKWNRPTLQTIQDELDRWWEECRKIWGDLKDWRKRRVERIYKLAHSYLDALDDHLTQQSTGSQPLDPVAFIEGFNREVNNHGFYAKESDTIFQQDTVDIDEGWLRQLAQSIDWYQRHTRERVSNEEFRRLAQGRLDETVWLKFDHVDGPTDRFLRLSVMCAYDNGYLLDWSGDSFVNCEVDPSMEVGIPRKREIPFEKRIDGPQQWRLWTEIVDRWLQAGNAKSGGENPSDGWDRYVEGVSQATLESVTGTSDASRRLRMLARKGWIRREDRLSPHTYYVMRKNFTGKLLKGFWSDSEDGVSYGEAVNPRRDYIDGPIYNLNRSKNNWTKDPREELYDDCFRDARRASRARAVISDTPEDGLLEDVSQGRIEVPVLVDSLGQILDGHHRMTMAGILDKDLPVKKVPGWEHGDYDVDKIASYLREEVAALDQPGAEASAAKVWAIYHLDEQPVDDRPDQVERDTVQSWADAIGIPYETMRDGIHEVDNSIQAPPSPETSEVQSEAQQDLLNASGRRDPSDGESYGAFMRLVEQAEDGSFLLTLAQHADRLRTLYRMMSPDMFEQCLEALSRLDVEETIRQGFDEGEDLPTVFREALDDIRNVVLFEHDDAASVSDDDHLVT